MAGRISSIDIDEIAENNLKMMDSILERRDICIDRETAVSSLKAMEAYLASGKDRFIIRYYSSLDEPQRKKFFEQMKLLLPSINNEEKLFRAFKDCLKDKRIEDLAVSIWLYDFDHHTDILSEEGFFRINEDHKEKIAERLRAAASRKEQE